MIILEGKIYFFSRYNKYAASSRLRIYSLYENLSLAGFSNRIHPFFKYNRFKTKGLIGWLKFVLSALFSVFERISIVNGLNKGDVVVVQYEVAPFLSSWLEIKVKQKGAYLVFDFDDAFYLSYKGYRFNFLRNKYKQILKRADLVITGSPLLSKYISKYNGNIIEVPTVVKDLYTEDSSVNENDKFIVGWIGSPTTSIYIDQISNTLKVFLDNHKDVELLLIGYSGKSFSNISRVKIVEWSEQNEQNLLPQIDVGIMPLPDDEWSNGKCGFKLIQYMAAGKPTIATPLQANKKIDGGMGNLFASTHEEWLSHLDFFFKHKKIALEVGKKNRERAIDEFIFSAVLPKYEKAITSLVR